MNFFIKTAYCQLLLLFFTEFSRATLFTSTKKIEIMVTKEAELLESLHIDVLHLAKAQVHLKFSDFYVRRMAVAKARQLDAVVHTIHHPNAAYHFVLEFYQEYQQLRDIIGPNMSESLTDHLALVPSYVDVVGAKRSFVRMQRIYGLNCTEMALGNYLGFHGPALSAKDAFEIGDRAFQDFAYNISSQWLSTSLYLLKSTEHHKDTDLPDEVKLKSLLARALLRIGREEEAKILQEEIMTLDPKSLHVAELNLELSRNATYKTATSPIEQGVENHGCDWNVTGQYSVAITNPSAQFCQYRPAKPPYYRFKQEVLSFSPFVCLFYEVVSDKETETLIDLASERLERALVVGVSGSTVNEGRVSDLAFVWDEESETVSRISRRVGAMTSLNTFQDPDSEFFAGEPQQIVNYGMGGHYGVHMDTFPENMTSNLESYVEKNGNRLATFLIYLSDVDRGGSTVFPNVGIHVKPQKNTALFWYSVTPSGEVDDMTSHAGCPIIAGHKWLSNKWIWTHGNMFTRRCGLHENSTQWDIESQIIRNWS